MPDWQRVTTVDTFSGLSGDSLYVRKGEKGKWSQGLFLFRHSPWGKCVPFQKVERLTGRWCVLSRFTSKNAKQRKECTAQGIFSTWTFYRTHMYSGNNRFPIVIICSNLHLACQTHFVPKRIRLGTPSKQGVCHQMSPFILFHMTSVEAFSSNKWEVPIVSPLFLLLLLLYFLILVDAKVILHSSSLTSVGHFSATEDPPF